MTGKGANEEEPSTTQPQAGAGDSVHFRSGAVARMLGMPVATLRVWERRYGLTRHALSPGGQRLYSVDDVQRLALVKQLADQGHAIGRLALLDMPQLKRVSTMHAQMRASAKHDECSEETPPLPSRPWRLAVIGVALANRLRRPALLRQLGRAVQLLGPFEDVAHAATVLQSSDADALLIHEPQLQENWLASVDALAPALVSVPKAVLYGFAADSVCDALATTGAVLLREPQPDAVLAQWLRGLSMSTLVPQPKVVLPASQVLPLAPRRWDDAALAEFAGQSSTIACECPRHVAELLTQLSHFEAYSAECEHRSAADAELHAYLRNVAATTRARFEAALEHVALHEGLLLPPPRNGASPGL